MAEYDLGTARGKIVLDFEDNTGPAEKKTRTFGEKVGETGQKIASGFKSMFAAASTAIVGAAAAGATSIIRTGVAYNSLEQSARAAFKTILGSSKAADSMMNKIAEFGKTSPFPRQAFIQGTQQMLAFGIETKKVIPYLGGIQDAVAAAGGSEADLRGIITTMSKIQSASKITAGDLLEFGNRGINAADLIGSQMGKTGAEIKTAISNGSLDATEALDALVAGMNKKFGGAAENIKKTFPGAIDRVKGAWRDLSSALIEPFVSKGGGGVAVAWANTFADAIRAVIPPIQQMATAFSDKIRPSLESMSAKASEFVKGFDLPSLISQVSQFGAILLPLFGAMISASAGVAGNIPLIGGAFRMLTGPIGIIVGLIGAMVASSPELRSALGTTLQTIAGILQKLAPLFAAAFAAASKAIPPLADALAKILNGLFGFPGAIDAWTTALVALGAGVAVFKTIQTGITIFNAAKKAILAARAAMLAFNIAMIANPVGIVIAAIAALVAALVWFFTQTETGRSAWASFVSWLQGLWQGLVGFAQTVWNAVVAAWNGAVAAVTGAWNGVLAFFTTLWTNIVTGAQLGWNTLVAAIQAAAAVILPVITAPFTAAAAVLNGVWETIKAAIAAAFLVIVGLFTGNYGLIVQAATGFWTTLQGIWSTAWATIQSAVGAAWGAISGLFSAAWGRIQSIVVAGWNAVKNAFTSAIAAVVSFVAQLPGKAAAALASLGAKIVQVATSAWNSFKSAVTTGISNVISIVRDLPGKAVSALGSFAGMMADVGRNVINGLIRGIQNAAGAVVSALKSVVEGAINAAKRALGIASPSKVFKDIGKFVVAGLAQGIATSASAATSAINKVITEINRVAGRAVGKAEKKRAKAAASAVSNMLKLQNRLTGATQLSKMTLADIGKAREGLADQIKEQNKVLADLVAESNKMRDDIAKRITDSFNLGSFVKKGKASFDAINKGLAESLAKAQRFRDALGKLGGVPADVVERISSLGVDQGIAVAEAFANASAADRETFIKNWQALGDTANQVGTTVADRMYKVGIDAQKGLIAGLEAQDKALATAAEKLVDSLVKAVKKKLGIKSPSRVMMDVGIDTLLGFNKGLEKEADGITKTVASLAKRIPAVMSTVGVSAGMDRTIIRDTSLSTATSAASRNAALAVVPAGEGNTHNEFHGDILVPLKDLEELDAFTAFLEEWRRIQRQEVGV